MTSDERFECIELVTASIAEQRRKDREEYRALWRDTERQMNEMASGMNELRRNISELAVESRLRNEEAPRPDRRAGTRISRRRQAAGRAHRITEVRRRPIHRQAVRQSASRFSPQPLHPAS